MSDKKKRSMAGLPWIAAMAFFMFEAGIVTVAGMEWAGIPSVSGTS